MKHKALLYISRNNVTFNTQKVYHKKVKRLNFGLNRAYFKVHKRQLTFFPHFCFPLPMYSEKKFCFKVQFSKLIFTRFETKITFLEVGLYLTKTPLYVCYQFNSFDILHLYYMLVLFETFYEDRVISLSTGAHIKILIYCGLWTNLFVSTLSYI